MNKRTSHGLPGIYNSSPLSLNDGEGAALALDDTGTVKTAFSTKLAGEDTSADVLVTQQRVTYTNISADTLIATGIGRFFGFIVNSHTSGTVKVWDNTSAATTVLLNTITLAAGPQSWALPVGIQFGTGLYVDVGGTIDLTVLWEQ